MTLVAAIALEPMHASCMAYYKKDSDWPLQTHKQEWIITKTIPLQLFTQDFHILGPPWDDYGFGPTWSLGPQLTSILSIRPTSLTRYNRLIISFAPLPLWVIIHWAAIRSAHRISLIQSVFIFQTQHSDWLQSVFTIDLTKGFRLPSIILLRWSVASLYPHLCSDINLITAEETLLDYQTLDRSHRLIVLYRTHCIERCTHTIPCIRPQLTVSVCGFVLVGSSGGWTLRWTLLNYGS